MHSVEQLQELYQHPVSKLVRQVTKYGIEKFSERKKYIKPFLDEEQTDKAVFIYFFFIIQNIVNIILPASDRNVFFFLLQ